MPSDMTLGVIAESQRKAAQVVGAAYLFALPPAIFAEFYVRNHLVAYHDAGLTAHNIIGHERLFRLGTASNLTVFAADVVLIVGLYLVLQRVNRGLALLATAWGVIETATLVGVLLTDLAVLRILTGGVQSDAFVPSQLQALALLPLGAHGDTYNVGLVFAGLRSTVFCYLWLVSRLVPKALAIWGVAASFLMGACAFAFIIWPELEKVLGVEIYGAPIFLFELTMGFWLLLARLRPSEVT
jgi:hypothetical protein